MSDLGAWLALLGLGAFHGINPAMGWLFAVGLGLQRQQRRAVVAALAPLALGHALSIAAVLLVVAAVGVAFPLAWVKWPAGAVMILFGAYKLVRSRHPRWVGMQVGFFDLTLWSFLMASAHGAGLMLVPIFLRHGGMADMGAHAGHAAAASAAAGTPALAVAAAAVHTIGYLLVTALVAIVVYEKVGVAILRKAWFNLDLVWAAALIAAGVITMI